MQPKEKTIHHYVSMRLSDEIGADVFQFNNKIIYALLITTARSQ